MNRLNTKHQEDQQRTNKWNPQGLPPQSPAAYQYPSSSPSALQPAFTGDYSRQVQSATNNRPVRSRTKQSPDNQSVSSQSTAVRKTLSDYEFSNNFGGQLGQGSYGTVRLAVDRQTKERVAIKIMEKSQIFKYCSVENLKREIKIQKKMLHPNICRLYHYFEDKHKVYLVLEYAQRGNLFDVLRKAQKMDEAVAFKYFFQTCLGIDHLHKNNVIHRDLKPENLLVDGESNVKVCDFGWSAESSANNIRTTFCGTVDYMAPEMVKHTPHDHRIDIWSLGVLLFELTHGYTPFSGTNQQQKLENIMRNKPVTFRQNLEFDLVDLIKNILQTNPEYRLSMEQIFKHPWMMRHYQRFRIDINGILEQRTLQIQPRLPPPIAAANLSRAQSLETANTSFQSEQDSFSSRNQYSQKSQQYVQQPLSARLNRQRSNDSYTSEDGDKRKYSRNTQRIHEQQNRNKGNALNRLDEEDEDNLGSSSISINYRNIKRINTQQQLQEESFFDKILIAFGCINRDKPKK